MKNLYLIEYSVKGIKSIDQWASLSFYKKTIDKTIDIHQYNTKGIYGANGAGKSAIIASVEMFKNLILNASYLSNEIVQQELKALVNRRLGSIEFIVKFLARTATITKLLTYHIEVAKDALGKYCIKRERLLSQKSMYANAKSTEVFSVEDGNMICPQPDEGFSDLLVNHTKNLLLQRSVTAAATNDVELIEGITKGLRQPLTQDIALTVMLGWNLDVYLEEDDNHSQYYLQATRLNKTDFSQSGLRKTIDQWMKIKSSQLNSLSAKPAKVLKADYDQFHHDVEQLIEFLQIFKTDLRGIEIDRKEDKDYYICNLIMQYDDYSVNAEFESTGIKKLIKLFAFFKSAVNGNTVFIDELDSNLHDVYLCALLEYMIEYGEGQLCFTTHNIGPMDVLKKNKKSIDFLSVDHTIHSWKKSGNYSPSMLYRKGMIEGSPFNVDSIDFIGVFDLNGAE